MLSNIIGGRMKSLLKLVLLSVLVVFSAKAQIIMDPYARGYLYTNFNHIRLDIQNISNRNISCQGWMHGMTQMGIQRSWYFFRFLPVGSVWSEIMWSNYNERFVASNANMFCRLEN